MKQKIFFYLFSLTGLLFCTLGYAQINPATNTIAVDVSTYHVENGTSTYDSSFSIGYGLGMREVGLFLNWTMLETAPNTFDFSYLDIANIYYPASTMAVDLNINPINTNRLEVPADLENLAFDDALMISRYKVLLDSVKVHLPDLTLSSFIIGSEIGAYLGSDANKWAQYTTFYNTVSAYAKSLWPGLHVAVELQFSDIMNYTTFAQQINVNSDYIGVSYYPLFPDFTVQPPSVVFSAMDTLADLFATKPICFYQFGYPSSTLCNSSDALQAEFISNTFSAWDAFAGHIRLIDFTWMTDLDTAAVNNFAAYYGLTDVSFLEFLRTLGLRSYDGNGVDKPALHTLRCEARQRGYNNLALTCAPAAIEKVGAASGNIVIFPNPSQGSFTVHVEEEGVIFVYDMLGNVCAHHQLFSGKQELNFFELRQGMYQVNFTGSDGTSFFKRIVIGNY